jgi:hypothetical protein
MTRRVVTRLDGTTLVVRIPMRFQRRGGRKRIVAPDGSEIAPSSKPQPDGALLKALARAWRWQCMLDEGGYSIRGIGEKEKINASYVSRILRLALLAPDIVEEILAGRVADGVVLEQFKKLIPAGWDEQRKLLSRSATCSVTSLEYPAAAASHGLDQKAAIQKVVPPLAAGLGN